MTTRHIVLVLLSIGVLFLAFSFPRTGQEPEYHNFADQREVFNIPNFFNVITNLPFVLIGIGGLLHLKRKVGKPHPVADVILLLGVVCIGFGSAWYHFRPANDTLVWDRIPMTITFMSYFSIVVSRCVDKTIGSSLLFPLLLLGIFSVGYWYITEQHGVGDLRWYALIQFYPMLCIPLILFLYPASRKMRLGVGSVVMVYGIAKLAEHYDQTIYSFGNLISGHSIKHLIASVSVLLMLLTLRE